MKQLPNLEGVLLEDCFVLSWHRAGDQLAFELDASLWPPHKDYEPPKQGEWTCYKPATLIFEGVESVSGLKSMSEANFTVDTDGSKDYGNIDGLSATASGFLIYGDFGEVTIGAKACHFLVK
jgi:hypothetical protein